MRRAIGLSGAIKLSRFENTSSAAISTSPVVFLVSKKYLQTRVWRPPRGRIYSHEQVPEVFLSGPITANKNQYSCRLGGGDSANLINGINETVADHEKPPVHANYSLEVPRNNARSRLRASHVSDSEKGTLNCELKRTRSGFKHSTPGSGASERPENK